MVSYTNNTFVLPPSSYITLTASNTTTSTNTSTISHDYQEHDYDSHHRRRRRRLSPPIIKCRCSWMSYLVMSSKVLSDLRDIYALCHFLL